MTVLSDLAPKSTIGRIAAVIWLCLCLGVLVFGYLERSLQGMAVAFTWLMVVLSFPLGIIGVMVAGIGWSSLLQSLGYPYQPFRDELPIWVFAVVIGYCQWFVLLPRFARRLVSLRKHLK